jgi:hypothetical protein
MLENSSIGGTLTSLFVIDKRAGMQVLVLSIRGFIRPGDAAMNIKKDSLAFCLATAECRKFADRELRAAYSIRLGLA